MENYMSVTMDTCKREADHVTMVCRGPVVFLRWKKCEIVMSCSNLSLFVLCRILCTMYVAFHLM